MKRMLYTTAGAVILVAGMSSLALAQSTYQAPSNRAPGAAAAGTANTTARAPAAGTANTAARAPAKATPTPAASGSSTPPSNAPCPRGETNYKGACYPAKPSAFPK